MKGTIQDNLEFLKLIALGISKEFGDNCEVVIHDYSLPFEHSIIHIDNGDVTNRKVGDSGSSIGLLIYKGKQTESGKYNYLSRTKDGKVIKSTTIYLKSEEGDVLGSLCLNYDITDLYVASKTLDSFINIEADQEESKDVSKEPVFDSINEVLAEMIESSISHVGIPVSKMTREDKIVGIKYLNQKGVFAIKNGVQEAANAYSVSKFTVYNYLND
jgi:predicted transcriptional regulator YheO